MVTYCRIRWVLNLLCDLPEKRQVSKGFVHHNYSDNRCVDLDLMCKRIFISCIWVASLLTKKSIIYVWILWIGNKKYIIGEPFFRALSRSDRSTTVLSSSYLICALVQCAMFSRPFQRILRSGEAG